MKKLSKTQQAIVDQMKAGSVLQKWHGYNASANLRGLGGWKLVSLATLNALFSKGVIREKSHKWPLSIWELGNP